MFKIIQTFATAPPTGVYSHVAPLSQYFLLLHALAENIHSIFVLLHSQNDQLSA